MSDCCKSYKDKNFCADCGKRTSSTYFNELPKDLTTELIKACNRVGISSFYNKNILVMLDCFCKILDSTILVCTYCKNKFEYKKGITVVIFNDTLFEICHNNMNCFTDIIKRSNVIKQVYISPNHEIYDKIHILYPLLNENKLNNDELYKDYQEVLSKTTLPKEDSSNEEKND